MPQAGTRSRSPRICFSHRFYCALAADSEVLLDGSDFYDCVFVCVWEVFTIGVRSVYDISVIGDITHGDISVISRARDPRYDFSPKHMTMNWIIVDHTI